MRPHSEGKTTVPVSERPARANRTLRVASRWHPRVFGLCYLSVLQRKQVSLGTSIFPARVDRAASLFTPSSYPKIGFYIGRRMHRPGLAELEPLVAHAERLPLDGVDGQDYLR